VQKGAKNLFANKIVKKFGLPKDSRIYLKNDFKSILKTGKKVYKEGVILWCKPNPAVAGSNASSKRRIGIIVSKKLGGAVQRNRCKRLFREAFRLNRHLLAEGIDCIFYPKDITKPVNYQAVRALFLALAEKAEILKNNKEPRK
jgi:ribonuclease P protein component